MSKAVRFYLDEHVGQAIAKGLRRSSIDVLTLGAMVQGLTPTAQVLTVEELRGHVAFI